jgi:hypothetical protein
MRLAALLAVVAASFARADDPWPGVAAHYQHGVIGEKVTYRAVDAGGAERSSTVLLRLDHDQPAAPAIRLDLGNLVVYADRTRIVAAHAGNPGTYLERTVENGLSPRAFEDALPPLVLPQLGWAFSSPHADAWWDIFGVGRVQMILDESAGLDANVLKVLQHSGAARLEALSLRPARSNLALASMKVAYPHGSLTLDLTSEDLAPADIGDASTWVINTDKRTRVESLTDLKPLPGEVAVGDACPPLGLVTSRIEGWSFADAVKRLQGQNPQPPGPAWVALLVRVPSGPAPAVVPQAVRGLDGLVREFSIQRMQGLRGSPRLEAHEVLVLELGEVNAQRVAELSREQVAGADSIAERLFSTTGKATFWRIAPEAAAAVIVLDERQRIAGLVRLDGRLVDAGTIAAEVRRIISTVPAPE